MVGTDLTILSVNMCHQNDMSHTLLHTFTAHILAIQEPWFSHISLSHSDTNPASSSTLGGVANNHWVCLSPHISGNTPTKTLIYIQCSLFDSLTIIPILSHSSPSPSLLLVEFTSTSGPTFYLLSVYYNIFNSSYSLTNLLFSSVNPTIPTLVLGDFNTHSHSWSLLSICPSPWATALKTWFACKNLHYLNPPSIPT